MNKVIAQIELIKFLRLLILISLFFILSPHDAGALEILNNVYAEKCQVSDPATTHSYSFRRLNDGKIVRINKSQGDLSTWTVKSYKEEGLRLTVTYDTFIDSYRVTSDSVRLMSRMNLAGPNAYGFKVMGGINTESKQTTVAFDLCPRTSSLYSFYDAGQLQLSKEKRSVSQVNAEEARVQRERNKHPLCAKDPYVGVAYDCDPERQLAEQRALELIMHGKDPWTGQDMCPSEKQLSKARTTCAPANDFDQCMRRLLPDYGMCRNLR
jgi:hypothetical protein